ncbi:MarR family winged helix-turn-helix transcriptional regulator [Gammaproteobacteria bacterium AS21]
MTNSVKVTQSLDHSENTETKVKLPLLNEIGLDQFMPYLLIQIVGHWNGHIQNELRQSELTNIKARILAVLSLKPDISVNQLSALTVVEQSTISRALDSLESQGYIYRLTGKSDARVRRIFISDKGSAVFNQVWPAIYSSSNLLMENITDTEKEFLVSILHKMITNIKPKKDS